MFNKKILSVFFTYIASLYLVAYSKDTPTESYDYIFRRVFGETNRQDALAHFITNYIKIAATIFDPNSLYLFDIVDIKHLSEYSSEWVIKELYKRMKKDGTNSDGIPIVVMVGSGDGEQRAGLLPDAGELIVLPAEDNATGESSSDEDNPNKGEHNEITQNDSISEGNAKAAWDSAVSKIKDCLKRDETFKKILRSGTSRTVSNPGDARTYGDITGSLVSILDWVVDDITEIRWDKLLNVTLFGSSTSNEHYRSFRRVSRRSNISYLSKGTVRKGVDKLLLVIDTSGSMSSSDFNAVIAIIKQGECYGYDLYVVQWDTEKKSEVVKLSEFYDSTSGYTFYGRGGTDMVSALLWVNSLNEFSSVVVLTDGYTPYFTNIEAFPNRNTKITWVLTSKNSSKLLTDCVHSVVRLYP